MQEPIKRKYLRLVSTLNERERRLWATNEAKTMGYGGVSLVSRASGISRSAIHTGLTELKELNSFGNLLDDRIRKLGGGRKHLTQQYPRLNDELLKLVEPQTRGDPKSALCWVAKSSRALATELEAKGIAVCHQSVCAVLSAAGYSLQANQKTLGKGIPDGVYDIQANEAWVSVGNDHDTAQFAVASLQAWWRNMGQQRYGDINGILITADSGGSNGNRSRL